MMKTGWLLCIPERFGERNCKLIGAGGGFRSAFDAAQTLDGFFGGHARDKSRDSFGIAGTASRKRNFLYDIAVEDNVNGA